MRPTAFALTLAFAVLLGGAVVAFTAGVFSPLTRGLPSPLGSGDQFHVDALDMFGTSSTPVRLSGSMVTSSVYRTAGCDKFLVAGAYTPATNNAYLEILVEGSVDDGRLFFPLSTTAVGSVETLVYADSGTGMNASSGIPFIIPGDKSSVAGRNVTSTFIELSNLAFNQVRITPFESVTTTNGTAWLRGACKSGS